MGRCSNCGHENVDTARFCESCGAPQDAQQDWSRRLITVVSVEITLVSLGAGPDPERSVPILKEFAESARRIIASHGGTTTAADGSHELLATFGGRHSGSDDPIRGVSAALELVRSIVDGGTASERRLFASAKAGIATGRVVTAGRDQPEDASRELIELATETRTSTQPGTVAITGETHALIGDAIEVTESPGLIGYRVHSLKSRVTPQDSPLVGRDLELAAIRSAFDESVAERKTTLVTIVAESGGGKSRLMQEATSHLGATMATARCSGEGSAQGWAPLASIVERLIGSHSSIDDAIAAKVESAPEQEREMIRRRLGALFGSGQESSMQEMFWAARRLLEIIAAERPLVIGLDDLQWAEQSILDLIEYIALFSKDAAILLVCLSRPDLFEDHPGWPGSGLTLTLKPLSAEDMRTMLSAASISDDEITRVIDLAAGNPLFVEEGAAFLTETDEVALPSTTQGVIEARLDRLPVRYQNVAQTASVIDADFTPAIVAAIGDLPEEEVTDAFESLSSRGIITRVNGSYSFKHVVLRQAAYNRLPLGPRAQLHDRYARLLLTTAGERHDGVTIGAHLEAAHSACAQIDPQDPRLAEIGTTAGELLGAAGEGALAWGNAASAGGLLRRALSLLPPGHPRRSWLTIDLARCLMDEGDLEGATGVLQEIPQDVDPAVTARAQLQRLAVENLAPSGDWQDRMKEDIGACLRELEKSHDHKGMSLGYQLLAEIEWELENYEETIELLQSALSHALSGELTREAEDIIGWLLAADFWGPTPVDVAINRCEQVLGGAVPGSLLEAKASFWLASTRALTGAFDEVRGSQRDSIARLNELGLRFVAATYTQVTGLLELMANNPESAEAQLRLGYDILEQMGDNAYRATLAAVLSRSLLLQGRIDEAYEMTLVSEDVAGNDGYISGLWGPTRARILAERGEVEAAMALMREALRTARESGDVITKGATLMECATLLEWIGQPREAKDLYIEARRIYQMKGIAPELERIDAALRGLPTG